MDHYLDCFDSKNSEEIVAAHDNLYLAFGKLPLYEHFYRKKNHPYRTRMELIGDDREETLAKNNEIWQTHQRAYKKYYARVLKNNMTKEEFTAWAKDAEKLRDKALSEYELVQDDDRLWIIAKLKQDLNEK